MEENLLEKFGIESSLQAGTEESLINSMENIKSPVIIYFKRS